MINKLPNTVEKIKGVGRKITATKIKREGNICLYKRSDNTFEVFEVKTIASNMFNDNNDDDIENEHEVYPSNEQFGKSAYCYNNYSDAFERYSELIK